MNKTSETKIVECIFNIDMICRSMYQSYEDCITLQIPKETVLYSDLLRYSYLQLCIILDEFEILNGLAKDNQYLKDTLYVVSPIAKALNKYSGIRKARNYLFAHFNRDRKGNFEPWWIVLKDAPLPRTKKEIELVYTWLHLLNAFLVTRYYEEYSKMTKLIEPDFFSFVDWSKSKEQEVAIITPFDSLPEEMKKRFIEKDIEDKLILDPIMSRVLKHLENAEKSNW